MNLYRAILSSLLLFFSTICLATDAGLFSDKQVLNGSVLYNQHCASCRGVDLSGGIASAVKGDDFLSRWSARSQTIGDLYFVVRTSMPLGGAGIITYAIDGKQYVAVATGPASSIWLQPPATSKIMLFALPDNQ